MILTELTLTNFGLYGGENRFDLSPDIDNDRSIVLVRGHNGGGKTTFLEAVRLALYGKRALGPRVARSDYETYLLRRIYSLADQRSASVSLSFWRQENGNTVNYTVMRAWAARGASVVETVKLDRDGTSVDDIPMEDWDHYLEDMIPSGISQLFFFDGEKIQDIADGANTDGLRDAVRSLLGLDIIDQLRSDLALYTARRNPSGNSADIEAIERDLKAARGDLILAEEEAAQYRADRTQADRLIAKAQKAFDDEGGTAALDRAGLRQTLREVEKLVDLLQTDLKRLAESPLPLALAPKLTERLREAASQSGTVDPEAIATFIEAFEASHSTKTSEHPIWTKNHFLALREFLNLASDGHHSVQLEAEPAWIKGRIEIIDGGLKDQAAALGDKIEAVRKRQAQLKRQLTNFDENAASETLTTLKSAEYKRGHADAELAAKERGINALRFRIDQLEKERRRALDVELDKSLAIEKIGLGERARAALAAYETKVLERRINTLSEHFVACFNGLIRKRWLLRSVRIDPDNFEITLIGEDGVKIPKMALSAGERQIFAISMLWALGKTSGRDLPIIIDTPLSRLDRTHRTALMRDYVPEASRQIILLCTDSELTPELDKLVSPHVVRRYEIGVSDGNRRTQVTSRAKETAYAH